MSDDDGRRRFPRLRALAAFAAAFVMDAVDGGIRYQDLARAFTRATEHKDTTTDGET